MEYTQECDGLAAAVDSFANAIEGADLSTPVPTCPEWTLRDLVTHMGQIHRWVDGIVRERLQERSRGGRDAQPGNDAAGWLRDGGNGLVEALRGCDPDEPVWGWANDNHARFWSRRQMHETYIHGADALLALGQPVQIPAAVAADGVDELLDIMPAAAYFAPKVAELRGGGETIHIHATDTPDGTGVGEWLITLEPAGYSYTHGHAKGDVAVRGAISDLNLLIYNRASLGDGRFEVFGDNALIERWLAHAQL
jgi:uncharacterized protein (TIGR03083 family)